MDMEHKVLIIGSIISGGALVLAILLKYCIIPKASDYLNELEKGHGHGHPHPHPEGGR